MSQRSRSPLTWRPIVPGSDQHLALIGRTRTPVEQLGRVLYPGLYARRDQDAHRRACAAMAAASSRVSPDKAEAPSLPGPEASPLPDSAATEIEDGCYTECA